MSFINNWFIVIAGSLLTLNLDPVDLTRGRGGSKAGGNERPLWSSPLCPDTGCWPRGGPHRSFLESSTQPSSSCAPPRPWSSASSPSVAAMAPGRRPPHSDCGTSALAPTRLGCISSETQVRPMCPGWPQICWWPAGVATLASGVHTSFPGAPHSVPVVQGPPLPPCLSCSPSFMGSWVS